MFIVGDESGCTVSRAVEKLVLMWPPVNVVVVVAIGAAAAVADAGGGGAARPRDVAVMCGNDPDEELGGRRTFPPDARLGSAPPPWKLAVLDTRDMGGEPDGDGDPDADAEAEADAEADAVLGEAVAERVGRSTAEADCAGTAVPDMAARAVDERDTGRRLGSTRNGGASNPSSMTLAGACGLWWGLLSGGVGGEAGCTNAAAGGDDGAKGGGAGSAAAGVGTTGDATGGVATGTPGTTSPPSNAGTTIAPLGNCTTGMDGVGAPKACAASICASSTSSHVGGWIIKLRLGTPRASRARTSGVSSWMKRHRAPYRQCPVSWNALHMDVL